MNVYDFDNTILKGDSTARFFAYCLRHTPRMWRELPAQLVNALLFVFKLKPKQAFKQRMLAFVALLPDPQDTIERFWDANEGRVKRWYGETRRADDVVISASPEFLIAPICARMGISCAMGSPVDLHSGKFLGPNCHGEEKVRRFYQAFPEGEIENFYSDSHSDDPLARLARRAYLVRGERLLDWNSK